jgi:protein-S-isoprenylcysteine O-methyltransferase Ste14
MMLAKLKLKDTIFVAVQMLLLLALLFPIIDYNFAIIDEVKSISTIIKWIGFAIIATAILQLNKNITPFPTPKQGSQLIQSGLFKYIRHPIYTGILLVAFCMAIYNGSVWQFITSFLLVILFYFKSSYEETELTKVFWEYNNYKQKVGRFLPKW